MSCALLLVALGMPRTSVSQEARSHKRVLLLHSFGRDSAPFAPTASTLRTELARLSPQPVEFVEAFLQIGGPAEDPDGGPEADYLDALLSERQVDLFISVGAPAAMFSLQQHRRRHWRVPLLMTGLDHRAIPPSLEESYAAAGSSAHDLPAIVEHILRLLPDTDHIVVVLGDSSLSEYWRQEAEREFAGFADSVRFTWTNEWPLEEIQNRLATLPPRSAILFGLMIVDAAGVPYFGHAALESLHEVANAPIFGIFESQLGHGIVGGSLSSEAENGRRAARAAARILGGALPEGVVEPPVANVSPVYDYRELERWGIRETLLPEGSTTQYRPPSVLALYRWSILVALGVVGLQAVLIAGLLVQRRRRCAAEEEARTFGQRLLTAHEDERKRLSRELHDDLTQRLARLALDAAQIQRELAGSPGAESAAGMRADLVRLSEDVHALSYQLHPSVLDDLGLGQALQVECDRFSRREPISATLAAFEPPSELPAAVAGCLFRIAQEALRNVARHSRASAARVVVASSNGGVRLVVQDDGIGFNPANLPRHHGLGHTSMRERAVLVHGTLDIQSAPGQGTTITVWAPLAGEDQ